MVRNTFLVHLVSDAFDVGDLCDDPPTFVMQLNRKELTAALCLIGCMLRSAAQLQVLLHAWLRSQSGLSPRDSIICPLEILDFSIHNVPASSHELNAAACDTHFYRRYQVLGHAQGGLPHCPLRATLWLVRDAVSQERPKKGPRTAFS